MLTLIAISILLLIETNPLTREQISETEYNEEEVQEDLDEIQELLDGIVIEEKKE